MNAWKRTMAAAGMGIMLMASSVYGSADDSEYMEFTDNELVDGSLIYYFKEMEITLPADWKGKFDIEINGNNATFYHKASREKWRASNGTDGGKLFTLSCSVNDDFAELPDFSYIGFSDESAMNYFMIFPTDVQAYMDDNTIAEEFQQMNSEIDFVKENARMLGTGEKTDRTGESYQFDESQAGYKGTWVDMKGGFRAYLPSDWNVMELDEEDRANGTDYVASSEDSSLIYIVVSKDLSEEMTEEEMKADLEENNMTMRDVLVDQLEKHGYTYEKEADINQIQTIFYTKEEDTYGTVFMGQDGMTLEMAFLMGENLKDNPTAETILHSVKWSE